MNVQKHRFQKLTPIDDVKLGAYQSALDFVFRNRDIRNIAISGPYGSGKTSVLESYKKCHPSSSFLHISLAHFEPGAKDSSSNYNANELEGKILNQLLHQIDPERTPQTRFGVKYSPSRKSLLISAFLTSTFAAISVYLWRFNYWNRFVHGLSEESWYRNIVYWSTAPSWRIAGGVLCFGILVWILYSAIKSVRHGTLFRRMSLKGYEIEVFEDGPKESFFDRYLNEVIYLFENCGADTIVFEDMDRFEMNRIFAKLREINCLVNRKLEMRKKERKIVRFFYLVRDDIFTSKDRTKFFDFIIPIVPILDSSNSYDQLISQFKEAGILALFNQSFLQDISLYIDDMRILKNIHNEFLIYNKQIQTTDLNYDKLLAMIVYKNIFPRDFAALQNGTGYAYTIINRKRYLAKLETDRIEMEIVDLGSTELMSEEDAAKLQTLRTHLDMIPSLRISQLLEENRELDAKAFAKPSDPIAQETESSQYSAMIRYLIRSGYLDETYQDYMTYFYEHSIARTDKVFLRSVLDREPKGYGHPLSDPVVVARRLRLVDYSNPETLNFNLLSHLLQTREKNSECLERLIRQIIEHKKWDFILEFLDLRQQVLPFVESLNRMWDKAWETLYPVMSEQQRRQYALDTLRASPESDILLQDRNHKLSDYISNCLTFLDGEIVDIQVIVSKMSSLKVRFITMNPALVDSALLNAVYQARLWEPNYHMVTVFLVSLYNVPVDDSLKTCNYSLVRTQGDEPLAIHVADNINLYVSSLLRECGGNIQDDEVTALSLLNHTKVSSSNKEIYISYLQTVISDIGSVSDKKLWDTLLKADVISYSETTILKYFFLSGSEFGQQLIEFVNKHPEQLTLDVKAIDEGFGENASQQFMKAVIACNALSNDKYEMILIAIDRMYEPLDLSGISDDKMEILIKHGILAMSAATLQFMREEYPDSVIHYIASNIHSYVTNVLSHSLYDRAEALLLLESAVKDNYKIRILGFESGSISVAGKTYSQELNLHVLKNNFDPNDIQMLFDSYPKLNTTMKKAIIDASVPHLARLIPKGLTAPYNLLTRLLNREELSKSLKVELLGNCVPSLNDTRIVESLRRLGLEHLLTILEGKRPLLPVDQGYAHLLDSLKNRGWISSYNKEGANYRVYGRRAS